MTQGAAVPLMAFQDQKLHEDSKSYQDIEDYPRKILPIKSRLEDFVQSRRISNIPEPQESENPPTSISWTASKIYTKDGNEWPRESPGSADPTPLARPTYPLPEVGFRFLFSHIFLRLYIATLGPETTHPIHYQGVKTATREGQQLEESRGSSF